MQFCDCKNAECQRAAVIIFHFQTIHYSRLLLFFASLLGAEPCLATGTSARMCLAGSLKMFTKTKNNNFQNVHYIIVSAVDSNFNIEIHSNFDHHTHGTSSVECDEHQHDGQEEEQHQHQHSDAGWVFNKDYEIPAGLKEYQGSLQINIPADAEEGEYHFMLRLTDHAGWQTIKSVPIHIETAM